MEHILVIMGYGFSLPENASDHYSLGFSPAIAAYIKATKARRSVSEPSSELLQSQSTVRSDDNRSCQVGGIMRIETEVLESSEDLNVKEILEQNIHWVRLIDNKKYEFSPDFLEYFSIAVENSREARLADAFPLSRTNLSREKTSRNQLHVICALIMILQKGQSAIRKHDKELPEAPQNSKQVDAARYRESQLEILDHVLNDLGSFLKSVEYGDPRVIRLELIFAKLPKTLLKDLRGVLNAGIRTRDPNKVRERGGLDFAFTAWLCGLWISAQSETKGDDQIDLMYIRWLLFLQRNYPEPSDETIHYQGKGKPECEERLEWFDPVRSASGNSGLDSALVARSYFDAVQVSTEKHPRSVYNDQRITVRRLEWCLNIVRNEGVWWPSLDQGEDEKADDWVMVLEFEDP